MVSRVRGQINQNDIKHQDQWNSTFFTFSLIVGGTTEKVLQWKRINHKKSAKWQHLSRLKASAFLFEIFLSCVKKHSNLYLRLVMPSSG